MKLIRLSGLMLTLTLVISSYTEAQTSLIGKALFPSHGYSAAQANEISSCDRILDEFLKEKGLPMELVKDAKAIVIFSDAIRAGFIFSAQYGDGVALFRDSTGEWSAPAFFRMTGFGVGLQAGGEVGDHILVVRTEKGVQALLQHHFTMGLDVGATAGPVGRNLDVSTNSRTDMLSYGQTKGLYAGVSLDGAVIKQDISANEKYYGIKLTAEDILFDNKAYMTVPAQELISTLDRHENLK